MFNVMKKASELLGSEELSEIIWLWAVTWYHRGNVTSFAPVSSKSQMTTPWVSLTQLVLCLTARTFWITPVNETINPFV